MAIKSKLTNDIQFFDPKTGNATCTLNQCRKKFKPAYAVDKWEMRGRMVEFVSCFHQCEECGRKHSTKQDQRISRTNVMWADSGQMTVKDQLAELEGKKR